MKYGFPPAKLAAIGLLVSFSDSNSVSDTVALTECGQPAVDRRPFRRRVRLLGLEKKDTEEKPTIVNFQDGATKPTICFQEHNYSFYRKLFFFGSHLSSRAKQLSCRYLRFSQFCSLGSIIPLTDTKGRLATPFYSSYINIRKPNFILSFSRFPRHLLYCKNLLFQYIFQSLFTKIK